MTRPRATYRLQLRNGMTFDKAATLSPYLASLGVSHLYLSPVFTAAPGSTHGYDAVDFSTLEEDIGGEAGFVRLSSALARHGLELIVDFVPNHMGANPHNPWWRDVLEWGAGSPYAHHFDIDWSAPKLIAPMLPEGYGALLKAGAFGFHLDPRDGGLSFTYGDLRLPLTPPSYASILSRIEDDDFMELARRFVVADPDSTRTLKADLAALAADPGVATKVAHAIARATADIDFVHDVHEAQVWRLTDWRAARETLTYRRFFEVADLVGLKVERASVFDDVHRTLLRLIADGHVQGVRLDHIDGLSDPAAYLETLRAQLPDSDNIYVVVEKILAHDEDLRPDWPVAGTTGYEFARALTGVFIDPGGEASMTRAYESVLQGPTDYPALVLDTKRRILTRNLAGELDILKGMAFALAQQDYVTRDIGADTLRRAILELACALPVYRTYINVAGPGEEDRRVLEFAMTAAKATREVDDERVLDFLMRLFLLDFESPERQAAALEFTARFQQTTGPVMAKALEDTTFYCYNRLIALNEVGGEPDRFGLDTEPFHAEMARRQQRQPHGLSATSTHDTKRGEDARARLCALSQMPDRWAMLTARWREHNDWLIRTLDGAPAPDPEMQWLFYQALAGAWPPDLAWDDGDGLATFAERMAQFMLKAAREAKTITNWRARNEPYEEALEHFVRAALDPHASSPFLRDFTTECEPVFVAGAINALAQTAIKLCAPGIPDIYQGAERHELSLVDPDNRRPVDFAGLARMLERAREIAPAAALDDWRSGMAKLCLTARGLDLRAEMPDLFAHGRYMGLPAAGSLARHVLAFARIHESDAVIVIATRLGLPLLAEVEKPIVPPARWGETAITLPPQLANRVWRNRLDDDAPMAATSIRIADALARFPAAILTSAN